MVPNSALNFRKSAHYTEINSIYGNEMLKRVRMAIYLVFKCPEGNPGWVCQCLRIREEDEVCSQGILVSCTIKQARRSMIKLSRHINEGTSSPVAIWISFSELPSEPFPVASSPSNLRFIGGVSIVLRSRQQFQSDAVVAMLHTFWRLRCHFPQIYVFSCLCCWFHSCCSPYLICRGGLFSHSPPKPWFFLSASIWSPRIIVTSLVVPVSSLKWVCCSMLSVLVRLSSFIFRVLFSLCMCLVVKIIKFCNF